MKDYIRIEVGTDGFTPGGGTVLEDSDTTLSCFRINYPKNFGESISAITIEFISDTTTANDAILGPGKEIQIYANTSLPVGYSLANRIFRGYVISKEVNGQQITIVANDMFVKTMWSTGTTTEDYDSSTSIKTVLTALCSRAGLTASNNAATPSPTNVSKFYSNQQNVFERIQYLLNLIGWYGYYDATTTQTIIFQPKSAGALLTFDDTNIISIPDWTNDSSALINDVILIGGSDQIKNKVYSVATTGAKGYNISGLSGVAIENVTVSLNSDLSNPWPIDRYQIMGPGTPGIWFTKETQPPTGYTLYIRYTYQTSLSDTPSTASNSVSQSEYVKRSKVIQRRDTVNSTDLTNWANNLVNSLGIASFWEIPIQEVSFLVLDDANPVLGAKADVTDISSGRTLTYAANGSIIYRVLLQWPSPTTKISISTKPLKNPMQQTTVQDSIEKTQMELNKIDPTSLVRKDGTTPILGSQDFAGNQLRNVRLENSAVPPDSLGYGGLYYDTDDASLYFNKNGVWTAVGIENGDVVANSTITLNHLTMWSNTTTKEIDNANWLSDAVDLYPLNSTTQSIGNANHFLGDGYFDGRIFFGDITDYITQGTNTIRVVMNSNTVFTFGDAVMTAAASLNSILATSSTIPEQAWIFNSATYKSAIRSYFSAASLPDDTARIFGIASEINASSKVKAGPWWGDTVGIYSGVLSGGAGMVNIWGYNSVVQNVAGFDGFMQGYECDVNVMFTPLPSAYMAVGISIASGGIYGGGVGMTVSCSNPTGSPNNRWAIGISLPDYYTISAINIRDNEKILWGTSYITANSNEIILQSITGTTYLRTTTGPLHLLPAAGAQLTLQSNADLYIGNSSNSHYLLFHTGTTPVTRLTISDTYIDATTSMLFRNTVNMMNNAYNSVYCYITNSATGEMELHTVGKLKVVVT